MDSHDDVLEALERVVLEIDAVTSIICDHDNFSNDDSGKQDNNFFVTTPESLDRAREYLKNTSDEFSIANIEVPSIGVETIVCGSDQSTTDGIRLRISLQAGYPSHVSAEVTVLSTPKEFPKSNLDELSTRLSIRAKEMIGYEAMLEIISECRDALDNWQTSLTVIKNDIEESSTNNSVLSSTKMSRRWIWVHHITNVSRIKQVVQEASQLCLGGYVKGGYPGVVVIEGPSDACDIFVVWIKGNKSRPGGFGRNWGHHVRGETEIESRLLPETFEELEDDMGRLGGLCKKYGVEAEFREFILQHR